MIGYGEYYPASVEAQDSTGAWQVIQKFFMPCCIAGLSHAYLYPGDATATLCHVPVGNFKTKVRVCYGVNIYFDTFTAYIRPGQIIQDSLK